jgi:O-antigen ligase
MTTGSNPLLGLGLKPRIDAINVPIGSHSTYIGTFIKSGFLGIFFLFSWIFMSLLKLSKSAPTSNLMYKLCLFSILTIFLWMITEDIDAPQFVSFTFFILLGILMKIANTERHSHSKILDISKIKRIKDHQNQPTTTS